MVTRRDAMVSSAAAATAALLRSRSSAASQADRGGAGWEKSYSGGPVDAPAQTPGQPGRDYAPTVTPGGVTLPFKVVDGVKVFHLKAEEVAHEFAPGLKATCWGYNGRCHGPTIEAVEGDHVRVYVTNKLSAPTGMASTCPTAWTESAASRRRRSNRARPSNTSGRSDSTERLCTTRTMTR